MAVGPGGADEIPSLAAATTTTTTGTNTASGVLGLPANSGNAGSNTPYTTSIPGGGTVAGVPTVNQPITPVNPVISGNTTAATTTLNGGQATTSVNAPGVTTGVVGGSTGLPTASSGSVSTAVTPLNTVNTATSTNQGLSPLAPGAGTGSGLNNGIPASAGGGSLTTAPALPTTPTISTGALAPTQGGQTGTGNTGSAGTAGTVANAGGITPAPNLGQP